MKKLSKNIWIKDPIHGFLELNAGRDELYYELINSSSMQRLRRIKQLGTSFYIYPGAEHSRFTHALGTFFTARKTLDHFRGHGYIDERNYLSDLEMPVLASALLHDVGHLPFSHCFEPILNISHEIFTKGVIQGDTDINHILKAFDPELPEKIISLLEHSYPLPVGNAIISSQLDADRLDYICRDSYMTGANYGFLDINRIISVLAVQDNQLAVLEKGLGTIEEYLIARFYMYWEVYLHKTSRGMNLLLEKIFQRLKELARDNYSGAIFLEIIHDKRYGFLFRELNRVQCFEYIEDFLQIDDTDIYFILKKLSLEQDPVLRDLSQRFIERRLLKPVLVKNQEEKKGLKELVKAKGFRTEYYFLEDKPAKRIYHPNPIESAQNQGIKILMQDDNSLRDISEVSMIIAKLVKISYNQKEYVFVPDDVRTSFFQDRKKSIEKIEY
jgi:hypothetical protein